MQTIAIVTIWNYIHISTIHMLITYHIIHWVSGTGRVRSTLANGSSNGPSGVVPNCSTWSGSIFVTIQLSPRARCIPLSFVHLTDQPWVSGRAASAGRPSYTRLPLVLLTTGEWAKRNFRQRFFVIRTHTCEYRISHQLVKLVNQSNYSAINYIFVHHACMLNCSNNHKLWLLLQLLHTIKVQLHCDILQCYRYYYSRSGFRVSIEVMIIYYVTRSKKRDRSQ
jgi:hypothetical protein